MVSKNEEEWLRSFYEGSFLVKGWNARVKDMLAAIPPEKRDELKDLLGRLGNRIGPEWARENSVRRIDSSMLQKWGADLQSAAGDGYDAFIGTVRRLESEVESLLS